MATQIGEQLQRYAYNCISGAVKQEYKNRLNHWELHLKRIVEYAEKGRANVESTIKAAEEEQRRLFEQMMFVLSLVGGAAVSFVSGALKERVWPKLFGKPAHTPSYVPIKTPAFDKPPIPRVKTPLPKPKGPHNSPPTPKVEPKFEYVHVIDPQAHSRVSSKVFGDFGGTLVREFGAKVASTIAPAPSDQPLLSAINSVLDSPTLKGLENNLMDVWNAARTRGETAIENYAQTINKAFSWGDELIAGNIAGVPKYTGRTGPDDEPKIFAIYQGHVNAIIQAQRKKWASDWFYFGNDPRPISEPYAVNAIETEMWALWIVRQGLKLKAKTICSMGDCDDVGIQAETNGGLKFQPILQRLVQLGVVTSTAEVEMFRRQPGVAPGLQPAEVRDIRGEIDTGVELVSMLNWAVTRRPSYLSGHQGSNGAVPRTLGDFDPTNIPT